MSRLRQRWKLTGSVFSARVAQWTQRGVLKSIQSGSISLSGATTNTASITAVVPANAILLLQGQTYDAANDPASQIACTVVLTNATTVTATRVTGTNVPVVSFTVLEFAPGVIRSLQNYSVALSGVTSNTATITAVNTANTVLFLGGFLTDDPTGFGDRNCTKTVLTNSTTITVTRASAASSMTVVGQAVEFF